MTQKLLKQPTTVTLLFCACQIVTVKQPKTVSAILSLSDSNSKTIKTVCITLRLSDGFPNTFPQYDKCVQI